MAAVAILKVLFRLNRHFEILTRSPKVLVRKVAFVGLLRCIRIVYYWVASSNVHAKCRLDWFRIRELSELYYVPVIFTNKVFFTDKGLTNVTLLYYYSGPRAGVELTRLAWVCNPVKKHALSSRAGLAE